MSTSRRLVLLTALFAATWLAMTSHRVSAPPLDTHGWRQSLGLMVGRSWSCGQSAHLPRADACGPVGITPMELPLYAYAGAAVGWLTDPWRGGRLVSIGSTLAAMAGLVLLLFTLLKRRFPERAAVTGAVGGAAIYLFGPLPRHWMTSILPDPPAWGLTLLGAGLVAVLRPERTWALVGVALLTGIGMATKLFAAPFVVLPAAMLLFDRWRLGPRHALSRTAMFTGLAVLPSLLWYGLWNPRLAARTDCELFLLEKQSGFLAALSSRYLWETFPLHVKAAGGWLWPLALVGLPALLFVARLRALALVVGTFGAMWMIGLLGWHPKAHEYDGLVYVPLLAGSIGAVLALLAWGLMKLPERSGPPAIRVLVPLLLVVPAAWVAGAEAARREKPDSIQKATAAVDVSRVVEERGGVTLRALYDPRVAYFGGLSSQMVGHDRNVCSQRANEWDCAAWIRPPPGPKGVCRGGPGSFHVYFPDVQVHCGLQGASQGEQARGRLLEGSSARLDPPLPVSGGTVQAIDLRDDFLGRRLDVVLEAQRPAELPRKVSLEVNGRTMAFDVPGGARGVQAGALVVLREWLPASEEPARVAIGGRELVLEAHGRSPPAFRCVREPTHFPLTGASGK